MAGADFLRNFGLLVDRGEIRILAQRDSWSQHLDHPAVACLPILGWLQISPHRHVGGAHPSASLPTVEAPSSAPSLPTVEPHSGSPFLQYVLGEFPRVLNKSKVLPEPTHCMHHFLVTVGHLVTAKYRQLDNDRLEAAKKGVCRTGEAGDHQGVKQLLGLYSKS